MAEYNPPTEDITEFNTLLFNRPEEILSQAEADLLYLSRKGMATSSASSTSFSGSISASGVLSNSLRNSNTTSATTNGIYDNLFSGSTLTIGTSGSDNTIIGATEFTNNITMSGTAVVLTNNIQGTVNTGIKSLYTNLVSGASLSIGNSAATNTLNGATTCASGFASGTFRSTNATTAVGFGTTNTTSNITIGGALTTGNVIVGLAGMTGQITLNAATSCINRILHSATSYTFPFVDTAQGFYRTTTGVSETVVSGTPKTIVTLPTIPIGVWRIDFSVRTTVGAAGAGTITSSQSYISNTLNGAVGTSINFTGSELRSHTSEVYGNNDIQVITGSLTMNHTNASNIRYLNIVRTFATGTYSFIGEVSITRLA
jgi:hypothetical protein